MQGLFICETRPPRCCSKSSYAVLLPTLPNTQVADCADGSIYASAVVAAYDYALRMGAHIVQCSFGMSYPDNFSPTSAAPWYNAGQIQVYVSAIQPLQSKGMLVVAAAGEEGG